MQDSIQEAEVIKEQAKQSQQGPQIDVQTQINIDFKVMEVKLNLLHMAKDIAKESGKPDFLDTMYTTYFNLRAEVLNQPFPKAEPQV